MKKLFFTFILLSCLATASAQFSRPITIGAGAGAAYGMTDFKNSKAHFTWYGEGDYLISPFISVGLRAEKGTVSGNSMEETYKNSYYAGNVNAKLRLGKFMNLPDNYSYYTLVTSDFERILSNIYIGAGAGLMKNRIATNFSPEFQEGVAAIGGEIAQDRSGIHFVVPINVGVDIPFGRTLYGPQWAVNVNYQHTLTTNDNLDGVINKNNDQYGFLSVGVKYALFNRN
ncbi:outer membrane beta-barrel protein [Sphingobacterium faecium]|uniref:outer membrane beta-barrel protein n=1 Tax=Sphingobacterium faecium TaxID=34087 RepID=UPI00320AB7CA